MYVIELMEKATDHLRKAGMASAVKKGWRS
jgi:translation elongation factor EF-Ts